ncbi:tetratricopeptide repeat protein [Helicobacter salomonis]|uniref:tetratricopeptide repeat protein n=1 Tax=Helicobacter salomonis TaxID=56878 RepID=UPI000CF0BCE7|nr:SEL1-like repeat protein [Helicobacter salomonis]
MVPIQRNTRTRANHHSLSDDALLEMFHLYNATSQDQLAPHRLHNYLKAFKLYKQIILGKIAHGKVFYHLAQMYEKGEGVPQNEKKALDCYKGVVQHSPTTQWIYINALNKLIYAYETGCGVPQDTQKALEYKSKLQTSKSEVMGTLLRLYLKKGAPKTPKKISY